MDFISHINSYLWLALSIVLTWMLKPFLGSVGRIAVVDWQRPPWLQKEVMVASTLSNTHPVLAS